jgi:hypothetical protein
MRGARDGAAVRCVCLCVTVLARFRASVCTCACALVRACACVCLCTSFYLVHVLVWADHGATRGQVEEKATSLNSNDCFVLETPKTTWVWYGKGANGDERAAAKSVAETISPPAKVENAFESKEPADFWAALGGKAEYVTPPADPRTNSDPRLFQISNASGSVRAH